MRHGRDKAAKKPARAVGPDGWPLGGPSDVEIARAAEMRFKRDLRAALDRLQGGDLTAFPEAIRLCWRQHPGQFPYELVEASNVVVERAMPEAERLARRAYRIHLTRWEEVTELLERGQELLAAGKARVERATRRLIAVKPTDEKGVRERARLIELLPALVEEANDDRGTSVDRASEAIAKVLKETDAKGRVRTIKGRTVKASYELIEAAGGKNLTFETYRREVQRRDLLRRRGQERG